MVQWSLAEQIATAVAGEPDGASAISGDLARLSDESERIVSAYTGLEPISPLPRGEGIGRAEWIAANLKSLQPALDPAAARAGDSFGPLGPVVRAGAGALIAAELGVLVGTMAQRVLGQYEVVLLDADSPARLLYVEPNLGAAVRSFEADEEEFLRWVTLHEVTHALQFGSVPWLRGHLAAMLRELLTSLDVKVDPGRLARVPTGEDLRALIARARSGDLISFAVGDGRADLLERLQATMAVIEGYAEHVMDAAGRPVIADLDGLRAAMRRRRATQSPLARILFKLIGLDAKLRQYEQGKAFCDAVVDEDGIDALNRVWASPDALPSASEIEFPGDWIDRTRVPAVTSS